MSFFRIVFGLLLLSLPLSRTGVASLPFTPSDSYTTTVAKKSVAQVSHFIEAVLESQEEELASPEKEQSDTHSSLHLGNLLGSFLNFTLPEYQRKIVSAFGSTVISVTLARRYILFHCLIIPF